MPLHERRDRRFRIRVPVTLVSRSREISVLTDNVSFRGVFLRMDSPPAKMQLIRMRLVLPPLGSELVLHPDSEDLPAVCAPPGSVDRVHRLHARHQAEIEVRLETR